MRLARSAVAALFLALVAVSTFPPLQANALLGWSLTASPSKLDVDVETDVTMRLTNNDLLSTIGCLRVRIPSDTQFRDGRVLSSTVAGDWQINDSGSDPTEVELFDNDGVAKLRMNDRVDFVLTVRPLQVGLSVWTADVYRRSDCTGGLLLSGIVLEFTLIGGILPTPTPTIRVTPTPTIAPTPTPTKAPTPTPTIAPTPTPTIAPTPTPTIRLTPTPTIAPTPTATSSPTVTSTPTQNPGATATPPVAPTPSAPRPPATHPTPGSGSTASPSATPSGEVVVPPGNSEPPSSPPEAAGPVTDPSAGPQTDKVVDSPIEFRYEMPDSLYSATTYTGADDFDTAIALGPPVSWVIPALVTGVPGILIILLVIAHVLIGASWLPAVGRLLGAEPEEADDDTHIWWAAGRPIG